MSGRAAGAQPWGLPQRVAMAGPGSLEGRWMWGVSERKATAAGPSATRRCRRRLLTMGNCGRDKPRKHLVHPHEPLSIANSRGAPRLDAGSLAGRVEGVAYLWRCLVVAAALRGELEGDQGKRQQRRDGSSSRMLARVSVAALSTTQRKESDDCLLLQLWPPFPPNSLLAHLAKEGKGTPPSSPADRSRPCGCPDFRHSPECQHIFSLLERSSVDDRSGVMSVFQRLSSTVETSNYRRRY